MQWGGPARLPARPFLRLSLGASLGPVFLYGYQGEFGRGPFEMTAIPPSAS